MINDEPSNQKFTSIMDQITPEQFRHVFFANVYHKELANAWVDINFDSRVEMNVLLNTICTKENIRLRYKRYSKFNDIKVRLVTNGPMFNVVPCDSLSPSVGFARGELIMFASAKPLEAMLRFYSNSIPTLEQAKKKLATEVKLNGDSFKLVSDDLVNDIGLTKILTFAEESVKIFNRNKQMRTSELLDRLQAKFEEDTKLKFSEISALYFGYSMSKFYNYLTDYGFSGIPALTTFPAKSQKDFVAYPSSFPMNGWEMSRQPDGYGHECGSSIDIDWTNLKLSSYGWSSDD